MIRRAALVALLLVAATLGALSGLAVRVVLMVLNLLSSLFELPTVIWNAVRKDQKK